MTRSKQVANHRRRKLYMSVGAIRGQYQPSEDVFTQGILLADDGTKFPAILHGQMEQQLMQQSELLNTQQFFAVWPCTSAESPELFLRLKSIRKEDPQQPGLLEANVDHFSISGLVLSQDSDVGKFVIQVKRNSKIPAGKEQDPAWQPFNLEIAGQLPDDAIEQFWELNCCRRANRLVLKTASPFVVPRPSKKPQSDLTSAPLAGKAAIPTAETSVTPSYPPANSNADLSLTPGQMEVVVKLNQFPNDVVTVDKGWKEFVVNTGSYTVTITVKPKAFTALEQAQQTYPSWVAAISGQMGEATATGFRLESPAIKVFERKGKETSQPEPTTSNERSSQSQTPGQMEITVKLNQFPGDVRTVNKGWKEFGVDTGAGVITISIKPKAFAALEQAQQTYPSWVAAISGQMGEVTATGFRLESPAIKVFERKPKDSSQREETKLQDNPAPPTTDSQLSPVETTLNEQQALPKAESQPQLSLPANPTQRVKEHLLQQRPTTSPPQQSQQQRSPTAPDQKQSTTTAPKAKAKSEKPAFQVKVNNQVFSGYDSVTLNKRVVRVDDVTVGQAKMVIVLGQPRTIQADGGVSQGRNQAVLTSR